MPAAFEAQTRIAVAAARAGIYELQSPGVVGLFSPEQALEQLLAGTGVMLWFTSATAASLDLRAQSEFVEVPGAPARVVASPKFTTPVRDIPQTITVIPNDVIQSQGATTLRDVLRNVTGISIQAGEGGVPAGDNLSIRGFSARKEEPERRGGHQMGRVRGPSRHERRRLPDCKNERAHAGHQSRRIRRRCSKASSSSAAWKWARMATSLRGGNSLGSYTYMDSEITRSNNAAEVGREFANTPDHSLSLWTTTGCGAVWSSGAEHSM